MYRGDAITVSALTIHLRVTRSSLFIILHARAGTSAAMSLKLDDAFQTSEGFWLRIHTSYDHAPVQKGRKTIGPSAFPATKVT